MVGNALPIHKPPFFSRSHEEENLRRLEWLFEKTKRVFTRSLDWLAQPICSKLSILLFPFVLCLLENGRPLVCPKIFIFSSFASYLTPFSRSERDTMSTDSLKLNISNSSTRNLKLRPVLHFDSLFWREEFFLDRLIFPIDALKFCPLSFPQVLLDLFDFFRLAPCQISPETYIILVAIFRSQEKTHLGLPRLDVVDFLGSYYFAQVSDSFLLFYRIVPRGDSDFAKLRS